MSLKIGIVGLPNVGKSSLFNALTKNNALVANYPFATIEPNVGVVKFLDDRITKLSELISPEKTTYATIDFVDIAGLVKGASAGEGLGNKFLDHIRAVDLICMVVRCFESKEIIHVNAKLDPVLDTQVIMWELIYSDIERIKKIIKKLKSNDPLIKLLDQLLEHLEKGLFISSLNLSDEDKFKLKGYQLLTEKPWFLLINATENNEHVTNIKNFAEQISVECLEMNVNLELEISKLPSEEQKEYIKAMGLENTTLNKLINFSFKKLQLSNFFTAGKQEVKSWTFQKNWSIKQCAGLIHSDLENGFIKAQIVKYEDFLKEPNFSKLQEEGKVSIMGKNYMAEDGDIVKIEFKA